jgi:hypothetical protein
VELLDPLAIGHIALASGDSLDVSCVDEEDLDSALFEDLVEGDPIDPRGLHGDGVDAAGLEPVGQCDEFVCEALELTHGLLVPIFGNRDPVAFAPDVDSSGVEVDLLEDLLFASGPLGGSSSTLAFHGGLLHGRGEEHPRAGMCRGSILLNGITPCVSPMRFSRHPRTKLTNGDRPPVARRPQPSDAPFIVGHAVSSRLRVFCPRFRGRGRVQS